VGLSTLRRLLEPDPNRAAASYLARDGDAYRLELPPGSSIDLRDLETAIAEARQARVAGDGPRARDALRRAFELYRGELLPEDGPASWVVEPRERIRGQVTQAAEWLATLALDATDPAEATRAALAGLVVDRYSDPLWRLLIEARDAAGDHGAAERARQEYAAVLAGLGVSDVDGGLGADPSVGPRSRRQRPANGSPTGNGHGSGYGPPSRDAPSVSPLGRVP
jgi:DNA-binding SARP family transcriptional activator